MSSMVKIDYSTCVLECGTLCPPRGGTCLVPVTERGHEAAERGDFGDGIV
jgi:hypothetical protein